MGGFPDLCKLSVGVPPVVASEARLKELFNLCEKIQTYQLTSTPGHDGMETACADGLPGAGICSFQRQSLQPGEPPSGSQLYPYSFGEGFANGEASYMGETPKTTLSHRQRAALPRQVSKIRA